MRRLWFLIPLALLAGCDDAMTDCPGAQPHAAATCGASGLTCYYGAQRCTCSGGAWQCGAGDMSVPDLALPHDMIEDD